jgi:6-phosphogluconolactonase
VTGASRVVVHPDLPTLAAAAAARLVTRLLDAQAARGRAHVVLTGGGVGIATLAAVAELPARQAVDWAAVDVWWGDERFLPEGNPDRNVTQARSALLDRLPLDPARVHPMPASDGASGDDVDAAAAAYARTLAAGTGPVPVFDVLMLGVGPDGHVASLFPGRPELGEAELSVIAVRDSPKPPPTRVSLTLPAINAAREVWLLAGGPDKAEAVGTALAGTGPDPLPAARVHGTEGTLWLLDRASAAHLPQ